MKEKLEKFIDWVIDEYNNKKKELVFRDKKFKIKVEEKSYGYIIWVNDKENPDPVSGQAMIIIKNGEIDFISNPDIINRFIEYHLD